MHSQFVSRFSPSCDEYKPFFSVLDELRIKKNKLDSEVSLIQKERILDNSYSPYTIITEKKHQILTKLLNEIEEDISLFNQNAGVNISNRDKSDEFWFALGLASRVLHTMIVEMPFLLAYRSIAKPMLGIAPSFCLAGVALFALPVTPYIAAVATLVGSLKFTAAFGFSQTTNYMAFPDSFGLVTRLVNELKKTLSQTTHISLPENCDIEMYYKVLGLENPTSLEAINEKLEELQNSHRTELHNINKIIEPDDPLRQNIADKMVETFRAGIIVTVHKVNYGQAYQPCKPK